MPTLSSAVSAWGVRVWALVVATALLVVLLVVLLLHGFQAMGRGNIGGITLSQFNSLAKGQSRSAVESNLGKPLSQQDVEYPDPPTGEACIYYFDSTGSLQGGTTFRLCFKSGLLDFKDGSGADFESQ